MLTIAGLTAAEISAIAFPMVVSESTDSFEIFRPAAYKSTGCPKFKAIMHANVAAGKNLHNLLLFNNIIPPAR
jgi:hypothetical protein